MKIDFDELEYIKATNEDEIGCVYMYRDEIVRVINEEKKKFVIELFECGLVDELNSKRLIPYTRISDYHLNDNDLILSHKKLETITYPREWSFEMFKDAALHVLEVLVTVMKYGFELKDCHGYNILFENNRPLYVDFGSIVEKGNFRNNIVIREIAFEHAWLYPLKIWQGEDAAILRTILNDYENYDTINNLQEFFYKNCNWIEKAEYKLSKILILTARFMDKLNSIVNEKIAPTTFKQKLAKILTCGFRFPHISSSWFDKVLMKQIEYEKKLINRIDFINNHSEWSNYNENMDADNDRYNTIKGWINELDDINTVWEWGANGGLFASRVLEQNNIVGRYICSDYDDCAVNKCYIKYKNNTVVNTYKVDVVKNIRTGLETSVYKRMRSDLVVAMALAHHLILRQGMALKCLVDRLYDSTNKYLIIEFMPMGLWDGSNSVDVPKWYDEKWFEMGFSNRFEIIKKQKLEKNRVCYLMRAIKR